MVENSSVVYASCKVVSAKCPTAPDTNSTSATEQIPNQPPRRDQRLADERDWTGNVKRQPRNLPTGKPRVKDDCQEGASAGMLAPSWQYLRFPDFEVLTKYAPPI